MGDRITPATAVSSPPHMAEGARGRQGSARAPGLLAPSTQHHPTVWGLTSAQRLRVVPVRVPHIDALDDGRALLQGVPGVTCELHSGAQVVGGVRGGEVPVLDVGLVAVAPLEGWKRNAPLAIGPRGWLGGALPSPLLTPSALGLYCCPQQETHPSIPTTVHRWPLPWRLLQAIRIDNSLSVLSHAGLTKPHFHCQSVPVTLSLSCQPLYLLSNLSWDSCTSLSSLRGMGCCGTDPSSRMCSNDNGSKSV